MPQPNGILDSFSRIARELLVTPHIKQSARLVLSHLDPHRAPALVRTLMTTDPALFLDVAASAPQAANALFSAAHEALKQVVAFPTATLRSAVAHAIAELDGERLGEALGLLLLAALRALSQQENGIEQFAQSVGRGALRGFEAGLEEGETGADLADGALSTCLALVVALGKATSEGGSAAPPGRVFVSGLARIVEEKQELIRDVLAPLIDAAQRGHQGEA